MTLSCDAPVGMFDSGVGGISVLRTAVRLMPHENFIYFGDTKNAPYGEKTEKAVQKLADHVVQKLLQKNIKALVIACNTATGAAAEMLRTRYDFPIIGMEPALKPASMLRKDGKVLVLATPVTLNTAKYQRLYAAYGENAVSVPCPGLMEFVERGELCSDALVSYLQALFAPYKEEKIDAVVLGCTHYVFLHSLMQACFPPETCICDGNEGTIHQLQRMLEAKGLLNEQKEEGRTEILSSGGADSVARMKMLFSIRE